MRIVSITWILTSWDVNRGSGDGAPSAPLSRAEGIRIHFNVHVYTYIYIHTFHFNTQRDLCVQGGIVNSC